MRIRLSDADRERMGIEPEWLDCDTDKMTVVELEHLQLAPAPHGVDPVEAIRLFEGWVPKQADGTPRRDESGRAVVVTNIRGWRIRTWCAVRRAGVTVPYEDFDFDFFGQQRETQAVDLDDEGKDEAPTTSDDSGADTTP